jgi:uncharacterized protein YyaL (SSP411 family)
MNSSPPQAPEKPRDAGKPNRLIHEKSPYLLQHAQNPVDWYPWGEEAFERARREDKPIFLSVGYSTCYWCHVMEREVFEDTAIARLMNERLVSIKVDREERPDVDRVYMTAVQAMTGSGGWPMSVFLTPELVPFLGATYIPPTARYGRPGFTDIVRHISDLWKNDRKKILESGNQIEEILRRSVRSAPAKVEDSALREGFKQIAAGYDPVHGGFGPGPKFPRPVTLDFLFRRYYRRGDSSALEMALTTIRKMSEGGVHDHIGGGFHRYSVDAQWRVPHFEKMLYDQAQLAVTCLEAYQLTHEPRYSSLARDILDYVARDMTGPDGEFFSAEDAESAIDPEGKGRKEEGAFYLWTKPEIERLLGSDAAPVFNYYFGVEDTGNAPSDPMGVFKGKNILYVAHDAAETARKFGKQAEEVTQLLEASKEKLVLERLKRSRPHLDDKIITAWNGLMISAFARAYQVLDDEEYLRRARRGAEFILENLYDKGSGTLYRRYRDGDARFEGSLQDYAFLIRGLLDLYEASFEPSWLRTAITLNKKQIELFRDSSGGGFFDGPGKDPSILVRTKEDYDGAEPAGNSIAAVNLLRLAQLTADEGLRDMAEKTIRAFGSRIAKLPESMPGMLAAYTWSITTPREIIISGEPGAADTKGLLAEVHSHFVPFRAILLADGGAGQEELASYLPFIRDMKTSDGIATAYICQNYACSLPSTDREVVAKLLSPPRHHRKEPARTD